MNGRERMPLRTFATYCQVGAGERTELVRVCKIQSTTPWSPLSDPYRRLIRTIQAVHAEGRPISDIEKAVRAERDPKRRQTISEAAAAYEEWLGDVDAECFPVAPTNWVVADAQVRVNPELGLVIDGVRHLVKLHFKKVDTLSETDASIIIHVMRDALARSAGEDCVMCVLDVRRGRLWVEGSQVSRLLPEALIAAASDLGARWNEAA